MIIKKKKNQCKRRHKATTRKFCGVASYKSHYFLDLPKVLFVFIEELSFKEKL